MNLLLSSMWIAFFLLSPGNQKASDLPYRIIQETASPRRTYVLAWGLRNTRVQWHRLDAERDAENTPYFDSLNLDEENVGNYIVQARSHKTLATLREFHFWSTGRYSQNHADMIVSWAPDESSVLLLYDGKWTYRAVAALWMRGSNPPLQISLGKKVDGYVRAQLARRRPTDYRKVKDRIAIELNNIRYVRSGRYECGFTASVPKEEEGFEANGRFQIAIQPKNGRLDSGLEGFRFN